jgi:hypothetical protein
MSIQRAIAVASSRPRGVYVPPEEVNALLANGWELLDDCPGSDEVLMLPPAVLDQEAA